jgi:hypothetical protein
VVVHFVIILGIIYHNFCLNFLFIINKTNYLHILLVLNNYTIFISLSRADLQFFLYIIIAQASLTIYHILLFVYKFLILNSDKMFLLKCTVII